MDERKWLAAGAFPSGALGSCHGWVLADVLHFLSFLRSSPFVVGRGQCIRSLEMEEVAAPAEAVAVDAAPAEEEEEEEEQQQQEPEVLGAKLHQQQEHLEEEQSERLQELEENVEPGVFQERFQELLQADVQQQAQSVGEQEGELEVKQQPAAEEVAPSSVVPLSQEEEEELRQQDDQQKDEGKAPTQKRDRDELEKEADKKWAGWPGDNVFRLLVPVQKVGGIIGRKGEFVKKMCEDTRSRIKVLEGVPGTPERIVCFSLPS